MRDSKQTNTLNSIRYMLNICSHPMMITGVYYVVFFQNGFVKVCFMLCGTIEAYMAKKKDREAIDEELERLQQLITEYHSTHSVSTSAGASSGSGSGSGGGGDLSSNKAFM